ncbi:hypothetical protein AAFO90_24375, partial [Phaeobacter sp. CAU 1743]|uniref:hypothetical protein n=1 Tax=Phaeobacter sp. CAU 1743 TaxID=3140367 RepID=UPI00325C1CC4
MPQELVAKIDAELSSLQYNRPLPMRRGEVGKVNRPGFAGEFFVQNLGDVIKSVYACVESFLHFLRRPIADGAM